VPRLPAFEPHRNINKSPHVVILGAGASRAAFPKGDANRKQLPLLADLPNCLELLTAISSAGFSANADFESIYDDLATSGRYLRKWVGYSATELAATTGFSKSIISRWENAKKLIAKESDRLLRLVIFAKMLENATGQTIAVDGKGLPNRIAEVGSLVKSLNLPELLRQIEDRHEVSPLRIDPSLPDPCAAVQ